MMNESNIKVLSNQMHVALVCIHCFLSYGCFQTEQFAVLWALFTVIVLGNSAVLVTMLLNKNRKSRMNFFIKQLAIAGRLVDSNDVLTINVYI